MREPITTNSFSGVAPGQTATLELPVGNLIYHNILFRYDTGTAGGPNQANMEAEIEEIRIKLNGIVQRTFSAAELFALNAINGIAVEAGFLQHFFSEPWRRSALGEDALGWGTSDLDTFQIEVDIASGATSPTLSATVEVERLPRKLGPIVKWRRFVLQPNAAGLLNVTNLPKLDAYLRLHTFANTITRQRVVVDQEEKFNQLDTESRRRYADAGLLVPAAMTSIIFDKTQRVADALPMATPLPGGGSKRVSEFRLDLTFSAPGSHTLLTETLGPRD